jgi:hypothetical protein
MLLACSLVPNHRSPSIMQSVQVRSSQEHPASSSSSPLSSLPARRLPSAALRRAAGLLAVLLLWAGLAAAPALSQARLQVIHNSPDPGASTVDIYVDNGSTPFIDDLSFRGAAGYVDVPISGSTQQFEIDVAPGTSSGPGDAVYTQNVTLEDGQAYAAIASGVLGDDFQLLLKTDARENVASTDGDVELFGVHGSPDAPNVDVQTNDGNTTLLSDIAYTELQPGSGSGYATVAPGSYTLDVNNASTGTTAATFVADLGSFANQTLTVLASGYLSPEDESFSTTPPGFGLIAVDANGTVITLQPVARAQIIHNSPDPAASTVDIYVDNGSTPFVNDLSFRDATAYVNVPAGTREIDVAPGSSSGPGDAVATQNVTFETGETYVAIASGVLNPGSFEPNPGGASTGFQLLLKPGAREFVDTQNGDVEFFGVHGSTDAPTVDVRTRTGTTLLDDVAYTDLSGYLAVSPTTYTLDVTVPNQNAVTASFAADLTGLNNRTATVLASGFLTTGGDDPSTPAFRLIAALDDGTVVTFSPDDTQRADVQVVHNAAGFGDVDVYVLDPAGNPLTKLDDFPFRGSLVFDVPAGEDLEVTVNASGSTGPGDQQVFSVSPVNLSQGSFNQAFAVGENASDFTLQLQPNRSTTSGASGEVDLLVGHQSPDAPTVDVLTRGFAAVDGFSYKDVVPSSGYLAVPESDYILRVGPDDNSTFVGSFSAPLQTLGLGGSTLTVLASGFLGRSPSFGLIAVPPANTSTNADEIVEAANADQNVTVLPAAPQDLVINEFFANPASGDDANGDGTAGGDSEEEFVEIVNRSGSAIDVSGYEIVDAAGNVYTFPSGTSIPAGDAATIFRGGTPTGVPGFTDVGLPALNNGGDDVILRNGSGTVLDQLTYTAFSPSQEGESTTRSPDFTGPAALSSTVGPDFTPGQTSDGNTDLPVELAGFSANVDASSVVLTWRTLSETNNSGFEVQQRRGEDGSYQTVGFREGQGTTTEATTYRFRVDDLEPGTYTFRLKQIDADGTATFSDEVRATLELKSAYTWTKVAPNPMRRSGEITMQVRKKQDVTVELYDVLGRRIQELHRGALAPGTTHRFQLDAASLPSGTYLLRARGETFRATQRVTVVR